MSVVELTHRQRKILIYFEDYWVRNGCGPSIRQVVNHLGAGTRAPIYKDIAKLRSQNLLYKIPNIRDRCYLPNLRGRFYPWSDRHE